MRDSRNTDSMIEVMTALWYAFYFYCNDMNFYHCDNAFHNCRNDYSDVGIEKECYEWTRFMKMGKYLKLDETVYEDLNQLTTDFLGRETDAYEKERINRIIGADMTLWILFTNDFTSETMPVRLNVNRLKADPREYSRYNRIMLAVGKHLPSSNSILNSVLTIRKQSNVPIMLYTESLKDVEVLRVLMDAVDGLKTVICSKEDVSYFTQFDCNYHAAHKSMYFYASKLAGKFNFSSYWRQNYQTEYKNIILDPMKNEIVYFSSQQ